MPMRSGITSLAVLLLSVKLMPGDAYRRHDDVKESLNLPTGADLKGTGAEVDDDGIIWYDAEGDEYSVPMGTSTMTTTPPATTKSATTSAPASTQTSLAQTTKTTTPPATTSTTLIPATTPKTTPKSLEKGASATTQRSTKAGRTTAAATNEQSNMDNGANMKSNDEILSPDFEEYEEDIIEEDEYATVTTTILTIPDLLRHVDTTPSTQMLVSMEFGAVSTTASDMPVAQRVTSTTSIVQRRQRPRLHSNSVPSKTRYGVVFLVVLIFGAGLVAGGLFIAYMY